MPTQPPRAALPVLLGRELEVFKELRKSHEAEQPHLKRAGFAACSVVPRACSV